MREYFNSKSVSIKPNIKKKIRLHFKFYQNIYILVTDKNLLHNIQKL